MRQANVHSWLGILIVLTTTYCYMNIALRMPSPTPPKVEQEKAHLLEDGKSSMEEGSGVVTEDEGEETSAPPSGRDRR